MVRAWLIKADSMNKKARKALRYDSLGLAYIASYIKKYGGFGNVAITSEGLDLTVDDVREVNPEFVGISSITQNFNVACDLAKKIKIALDIPVVVGGYHISALPNNLTEDTDAGVIGEGEQTFLELLLTYESKGLTPKTLNKIGGVCYRKDGALKLSPKRKPIKPLDKIPFPARDLLDNSLGNFYMFTSRGCPYSCSFCASSRFWGGARFHSAKYVLDEIKHLAETYKVKHIDFCDDLFIADKHRLFRIYKMLNLEDLDISFSCSGRANLIDGRIALSLKLMNVRKITLGLESGCSKTLEYLKGDSVTVAQNTQAVNTLKKFGLTVGASFIIGAPNETEHEILETLEFIKRSKIDVGKTYVLLPFPNTKLWDESEEAGIVCDLMDWNFFKIDADLQDRLTVSPLSVEKLKELDMLFRVEWRKRAFVYGLKHLDKAILSVYKTLKRNIA